jgi:archaellum component FlaC
MDRELIAYLGEQFAKQNEQVAQQFARQNEHFAQQFAKQNERFALIEERFDRQDERFARIEERLTRQEEHLVRIDESVRHTQVTVEGLWADLRLVAEGVVGMDERLGTFRTEMSQEIGNVQSLMRSVYSTMNQRIHSVEVRQDLKGRDPVDIIRERFANRPEKPPK